MTSTIGRQRIRKRRSNVELVRIWRAKEENKKGDREKQKYLKTPSRKLPKIVVDNDIGSKLKAESFDRNNCRIRQRMACPYEKLLMKSSSCGFELLMSWYIRESTTTLKETREEVESAIMDL